MAVSHNGAYVTYRRAWQQAQGSLDFVCPSAERTSPSTSEIGERPTKRSTLPTRSNAGDPSALSPRKWMQRKWK